jgi:hypothetical protein
MKEGYTPPQVGAILTKALAFSHQRCPGMTKRQVKTCDHPGADRQAWFLHLLYHVSRRLHVRLHVDDEQRAGEFDKIVGHKGGGTMHNVLCKECFEVCILD